MLLDLVQDIVIVAELPRRLFLILRNIYELSISITFTLSKTCN